MKINLEGVRLAEIEKIVSLLNDRGFEHHLIFVKSKAYLEIAPTRVLSSSNNTPLDICNIEYI
ncbi:MAG: hypothetical protein QXW70_04210 [Candidatus Anstonellales archaeon]